MGCNTPGFSVNYVGGKDVLVMAHRIPDFMRLPEAQKLLTALTKAIDEAQTVVDGGT